MWIFTVKSYEIVSRGKYNLKVTVNHHLKHSQDVSDDELSVRTVAYPDKRQLLSEPLPEWWIVVGSVIAGILVLIVICFILWRLGFFVRKLPDDLDDDADLMMSAHFEKVRLNGNSWKHFFEQTCGTYYDVRVNVRRYDVSLCVVITLAYASLRRKPMHRLY